MSEHRIEWLNLPGFKGETWSPITGCTPISEGCAHCYAQRMAKRLRGRCGYPADEPFRVTFHPDKLDEPLRWRDPRMVFVCSMGDLFHDAVRVQWIDEICTVAELCPKHIFVWLTKRPRQANGWRLNTPQQWPLPNVWLGVTAENQARADERIPVLLSIPAAVRFVSVEPMIAPVDIDKTCHVKPDQCWRDGSLSWVICGAETGPKARPMDLDWARSLRDQCQKAGVPFLLKKLNAHGDRELDGRVWEQYPEVRQ